MTTTSDIEEVSILALVRDNDVIDTRELVEERDAFCEDDPEDLPTILAINALFKEISDYAGDGPEDGITLIADTYFEDYARQLAEDIGAISGDEGWPLSCIDWEQAARELRMDYTSVEIDGSIYWYR